MSEPVVTGMGVVAPNGLGARAYWAATLAGKSGIGAITRFDALSYPVRLAGEVCDFYPADYIPSRLLGRTDRMTQMALVAAEWALADAGVDIAGLPCAAMGVVTSNASGGCEFLQRELAKLWRKGPDHVSAYMSFAWFHAANTGQLSIRNGMRGPSATLVTEQAGGLDAVGQARRNLGKDAQLVLTGGTDASLSPWGFASQISSGLLSTSPDPARAYLPFDADSCGYLPGEGGAILVLEDAASARARDARQVYGQIVGYAATFDPRPGSGRPPTLRRAIETALAQACLAPAEIDVVFADGAGVPESDRAEAEAITAMFGPFGVPVTVPKTMTGRLYAGGSALDLAAALLCIRDGIIPPTIGVSRRARGCDIDLVGEEPREVPVGAALVLARGHGGFNSALVVRGEGSPGDRRARGAGHGR